MPSSPSSASVRPGTEAVSLACIDSIADSLMRSHMHARQVVGASVAVIQRGRSVKRTALGDANLTTAELATPKTRFFIASITKIFTAAAVMALVEDGRLELDAPIGSIIKNAPPHWRRITVRHLLSSTSGLPSFRMGPGIYPATYDALLDSVRSKPLLADPGSVWRYEAPDYELLGEIIERASGSPFERFVSERLLRPAGIRSARFGDYRAIERSVAEWYSGTDDGRSIDAPRRNLRTAYPRYMWPSAGLHVTAPDLAHWIYAFANGRLVRAESVNSILAPTILADGTTFSRAFGGWFVSTTATGRWYSTGGGARAAAIYWRAGDVVVAVLTNTQGASPDRLARSIADLYVGQATNGRLAAPCYGQ